MTHGKVWSEVILSNNLTTEQVANLSAWALRVYFGPSSFFKRWYRPGVTEDDVLDEFLRTEAPISPEAMVEVWKAIPTLQAALARLDSEELDSVADYLQRDPDGDSIPRYTQGDCTLKQMAKNLGGITGTMVNKIFVSGADKLQRLTSGLSIAEMEANHLNAMFQGIHSIQAMAASEFASSLLSYKGNIGGFIAHQIDCLNLTPIEARALTVNEAEGLEILSEMDDHQRIVNILLADIEEIDNLFLTFQNAASKKIFPRRSGRPKGSGKKTAPSLPVELMEHTDDDVSTEELLELLDATVPNLRNEDPCEAT